MSLPLQELFQTLGRANESELEHIVPMLAKKAGEVSNAGRDTFLAADADRTLAVLVDCCSEGRVAAALLGCVAHKSPQTRAKVAAHLDSVAQGEHGQRLAGEGGPLSWAALAVLAAAAGAAHRKTWLKAVQLRLAALLACVWPSGGDPPDAHQGGSFTDSRGARAAPGRRG